MDASREIELEGHIIDSGIMTQVFDRIMDMGVMITPALALDGTVKSAGKILTKDQIVALLKGGN